MKNYRIVLSAGCDYFCHYGINIKAKNVEYIEEENALLIDGNIVRFNDLSIEKIYIPENKPDKELHILYKRKKERNWKYSNGICKFGYYSYFEYEGYKCEIAAENDSERIVISAASINTGAQGNYYEYWYMDGFPVGNYIAYDNYEQAYSKLQKLNKKQKANGEK